MHRYNPELLEFSNPRRHRRRSHRNPLSSLNPLSATASLRQWSQGTTLTDVAAAAGGLALVSIVPGMIIKNTSTMGGKLMKVAVAVGVALGAGMGAKSVMGPRAGQAAIAGGMAGAALQGLGAFTSIKIGEGQLALPMGRGRVIGNAEFVSPGLVRSDESISTIYP